MVSLLDAIHKLQEQVDALGRNMCKVPDLARRPEELMQPHKKSRYRVLHRIFCDKVEHCHHRVVFEDEPLVNDDMQWSHERLLKGERPIFNVETYVHQHQTLEFIIFKEYECFVSRKITEDSKSQLRALSPISGRKERMWIVSPALRSALADSVQSTRHRRAFIKTLVGEIDAPYELLCHACGVFVLEHKGFKPELESLFGYLLKYYESEYEEAVDLFKEGLVSKQHLGKLFRPNQLVIAQDKRLGISRVGVLDRWIPKRPEGVILEGWCWQYDGSSMVKTTWVKPVMVQLEQPMLIRNLPIFPLEYLNQHEKQDLQDRGTRFWNTRLGVCMEFAGWDASRSSFHEKSRVIVDIESHRDTHKPNRHHIEPFIRCKPNVDDDTEPAEIGESIDILSPSELSKELLMMLPPTTMGFHLQKKRWIHLRVDMLQDVTWNDDPFQQFVYDEERQRILTSLVDLHRRDGMAKESLVNTKGQGVFMLLHGPPGTGKTCTAECVAEYAKRPLYSVVPADLGTKVQEAETSLRDAFSAAERWGAVLLVDEADVFLEARSSNGLERNAIVSVFLRVMEYYRAILFLTTNRAGIIDEAFRSRIHLSLYFPKADKKMRKSIYNHFLDALEKDAFDVDIQGLRQHAKEVVEQKLDGRQIRNVLTTARQLAANRNERMDQSHVTQTLKVQKKQPGLSVYILTDGVWQDGPGVEEPIQNIISKLGETPQLDRKLGIQFVRFGERPRPEPEDSRSRSKKHSLNPRIGRRSGREGLSSRSTRFRSTRTPVEHNTRMKYPDTDESLTSDDVSDEGSDEG
ncbi:P-loop containing nucleoside triphosphate hydrolase protein [Lophiostoma macrostomum CBS 122681]|uniref:P-loop containing nucleoside triphosphate hydrolase protein n=1 Tax=Lophiostoma macrostomum CBS 122681 TaxID=1314788 RepID=A0A6A6TUA7_9PLEO|nr:P-loop containing nucleoside triphosphate hydrolase protein [Lophiostoma macrostomum CBS 122681]